MTPAGSSFGGFGGRWSDIKLEAVRSYFSAFNTALSKARFTRVYIDGFAGGGRIIPRTTGKSSENDDDADLFPGEVLTESEEKESEAFRHGSPLLALESDPPFHEFIFIERDQPTIEQLRSQVETAETLRGRPVKYICDDANSALVEICRMDWLRQRATVFLDPFALDLRWQTLAAIAKTEAMDMWLLFPAMAVNRMLPRHGDVPSSWAKRLDEIFGEPSWRQAFYAPPETPPLRDLFDDGLSTNRDEKRSDPFGRLSRYVTRRLKTVFADAVDSPLILKTESGSPLFLLCFAVANRRGAPIAMRIANHIIKMQSHGH